MRKILFPVWDSLGLLFVKQAFCDEGFFIEEYPIPQAEPDQARRAELTGRLATKLLDGGYEAVFSVNFLPMVAIAAKACRLPYLSWIYDNPCVEVYSETVTYETNHVFVFDRATYEDLVRKGVETAYYLPLAADVDYCAEAIGKADGDAFRSDISFVGSLYREIKPQFAPLESENGYLQGYVDGLVRAQTGIWGMNFLEEALSPRMLALMQSYCMMPQRVHSMESLAWIYANHYLAKKVTYQERRAILEALTELDCDLALYSGDDTSELAAVNNFGYVDYYSQAPVVFNHSKINLNITLKSIQQGIPLRCFDIMGCGGFLLSNFQAGLLELFVPGEDFVYYESIDDAARKAEYYLSHDDERERIARNGYEKVKAEHTYRHRVRAMCEVGLG